MCGICAIAGNSDVSLNLYRGLLALEYRGYDSCGITVFDGKELKLKKNVGEVKQVNQKEKFSHLQGNIGIAHTRWATHGGVTQKNAHPHFSNDGKFTIVHNGIIANYASKLSPSTFFLSFNSFPSNTVIPQESFDIPKPINLCKDSKKHHYCQLLHKYHTSVFKRNITGYSLFVFHN